MCDVVAALRRFIGTLPKDIHCALAVSGGLDSMVLLHAVARLQQPCTVYYVNHGLSPHAEEWAADVASMAHAHALPMQQLRITASPAAGESVEAWARAARYDALSNAVPPNTVILTAHHQADQAETVLLQLLRGAGSKGLSGMGVTKILCTQKNVQIARPFLHVPKAAMIAYAKTHALRWIEDESNADMRFDRNFIRHQAIPLLQQRAPGIMDTLSRVATHAQTQHALLEQSLVPWMPLLAGKHAGTLSIAALTKLEPAGIKVVLRHWLGIHQVRMPSTKALDTIMTDVVEASCDATPQVTIDDHVVTRYRDALYVLPRTQMQSLTGYEYHWDPREALILPHDAGMLTQTDLIRAAVDVAPGDTVHVRFRMGGDKVYVPGVGHQCLKKWFQTQNVPPWERTRVPLIPVGKGGSVILLHRRVDGRRSGSA